MNKKIFMSMVAIVAITLLLVIINIVYADGNLFVFAIIFLGSLLLSYFLSRATAEQLADEINKIDVHEPRKKNAPLEVAPHIEAIAELNRNFSKQLKDLKEQHESQDMIRQEFTANISHELKTPLTSISGYAELIANGMVKPEDVSRFAGKIHDESQRLIVLVGDIIKLSQLDEKEVRVNNEEIDLFETCTAVLHQLEKAIDDREISVTIKGDHLKINGVYQIVEEIIYNICDNAVKYNKPGGSIDIVLNKYIDGVEVAISDTGIGIAEDDMEHIFERFYRADKSHSKEIGGTGLGLSIVKHGATFMNAQVSVESTLGEGTTIRVLF